jgi:guanylate kinase
MAYGKEDFLENLNFDLYHPKPLLLIISGPSGVGKDTVVQTVQQREPDLKFVVTVTSRPMREGEKEGVDYHFVSGEEFERMIANNEFIEHALVYDQYKGVLRKPFEDAFALGKDVIMRLDVQGAEYMRTLFPEAVLIFLIPESKESWLQRLHERRGDSKQSLEVRIKECEEEFSRIPEFDYIVVNPQGQLDKAVNAVISIIEAEHRRIPHREVNINYG